MLSDLKILSCWLLTKTPSNVHLGSWTSGFSQFIWEIWDLNFWNGWVALKVMHLLFLFKKSVFSWGKIYAIDVLNFSVLSWQLVGSVKMCPSVLLNKALKSHLNLTSLQVSAEIVFYRPSSSCIWIVFLASAHLHLPVIAASNECYISVT